MLFATRSCWGRFHFIDDGRFYTGVVNKSFGQLFHGWHHPLGCFGCNYFYIITAMNKKKSIGCTVRIYTVLNQGNPVFPSLCAEHRKSIMTVGHVIDKGFQPQIRRTFILKPLTDKTGKTGR